MGIIQRLRNVEGATGLDYRYEVVGHDGNGKNKDSMKDKREMIRCH
jgi:hypothetical protein